MVNEVAFTKVPLPFDVQVIPALFVADDPAVMFTELELEQVFIAVPATAVGAAVMVSVLEELVKRPQPERP